MTYAIDTVRKFMANLYRFFDWLLDSAIEFLDFVVSRPALLVIVIAMPIILYSVSLFRRLKRM